jgi:hypothetical protein
MILHCVFCDFKNDTTLEQQNKVLAELSRFTKTLEGVQSFKYGPNRDFEMKSQRFTQGFVIEFQNKAALAHYAEHPTHQALGAQLVELCSDGADGIIVFDLDV